jgi:hypothetical protein
MIDGSKEVGPKIFVQFGCGWNAQAATVQRRDCVAVEAQANPLISVFPIRGPFFKTGNKQTAPDRLLERVRAPEMPTHMPGFGYARVATPGDQ